MITINIMNRRGMTIVELMTVMSIVAILVVMGSLSMDMIRKERIKSTSRELFADLQRLRTDAMIQGPTTTVPNPQGLGIRLESKSNYTLFKFNDTSGNYFYDGVAEEAEQIPKALPSTVIMNVKVGPAAPVDPINTVFAFDHFGFARYGTVGADWVVVEDDAASANSLLLILKDVTKSLPMRCIHVGSNRMREGVWNGVTCSE